MDRRTPVLGTGITWGRPGRTQRSGLTREGYAELVANRVRQVESARAAALSNGVSLEEWSSQVDDEIDAARRAEKAEAKARPCRRCGAEPHKPCRTASGRRAEDLHADRFVGGGE